VRGPHRRREHTGQGHSFAIAFPRAPDAARAVSATRVPRQAATAPATILLVEDDPAVRGVATAILTGASFRVLQAGGSAEAESTSASFVGKIDLLLTDVVMKGQSGPRMARELRDRRADLKILYVSGHAEELIATRVWCVRAFTSSPNPSRATRCLEKVRDVLASPSPARSAPDRPELRVASPRGASAEGTGTPWGFPYLMLHRDGRSCVGRSGFQPNVRAWAALSCSVSSSWSPAARWPPPPRSVPFPLTTRQAVRSRRRGWRRVIPTTVKAGPYALPGRVSFVNYDMGGDGVGYHTTRTTRRRTATATGRIARPRRSRSRDRQARSLLRHERGAGRDAVPERDDRDFYVGSVHRATGSTTRSTSRRRACTR